MRNYSQYMNPIYYLLFNYVYLYLMYNYSGQRYPVYYSLVRINYPINNPRYTLLTLGLYAVFF